MQRLVKPLVSAYQLFREQGVAASWPVLRKLVSPVAEIGIVHFFECDLERGLPTVRPIDGIIVREAFMSDVSLLDGTENASERKADAIERLKRGERWFVALDEANGKLANYRWVAAGPVLIPELQSNIVPRPGEVFIYALYTVPEYRRRGIDSFARKRIYDFLYRTSGVKKVLATIFAGNHASLRASRMFLREVGRVGYISMRFGKTVLVGRKTPTMPVLKRIPADSSVASTPLRSARC